MSPRRRDPQGIHAWSAKVRAVFTAAQTCSARKSTFFIAGASGGAAMSRQSEPWILEEEECLLISVKMIPCVPRENRRLRARSCVPPYPLR